MPTKGEKDALTGTEIRDHEWDGIRELNTPLPKWWVYIFWATVVWALVYFVLYPAVPGLSGYTKGLLGWSQRAEIEEQLAAAAARRAPFTERIGGMALDEIRADSELFNFALAGGRGAFGDNCAPCHGTGGSGAIGYPNLADDDWLWGGDIEDIAATVRYGVRSAHEDTRDSEMPRFGADEVLSADEIAAVAEHVLSLSGKATDTAAAERGAAIFAEQCAACHGEAGDGSQELGAPRLNDAIWLYGGDKDSVIETITLARRGVMPAWSGRLDESTIKMLAIYVHALGGGQ